MKFCYNCGNELKENADVCLKCGKLMNKSNFNQEIKSKIPGKGSSIAGMILGIIAAFWTICELLALEDINYTFNSFYSMSEFIGGIIGYTLFALTPSIVGLCLSATGCKKQKNGFNVAGIFLNTISLCITVVLIIYIFTLY